MKVLTIVVVMLVAYIMSYLFNHKQKEHLNIENKDEILSFVDMSGNIYYKKLSGLYGQKGAVGMIDESDFHEPYWMVHQKMVNGRKVTVNDLDVVSMDLI